jgi:hypothetical protein
VAVSHEAVLKWRIRASEGFVANWDTFFIIAFLVVGVALIVVTILSLRVAWLWEVVDGIFVLFTSSLKEHVELIEPLSIALGGDFEITNFSAISHLAPPVFWHVGAINWLIACVIASFVISVIVGVVAEEFIEVITSRVLAVSILVLPINNTLILIGAVVVAVIDIALNEPVEIIEAVVVESAFVAAILIIPVSIIVSVVITVHFIEFCAVLEEHEVIFLTFEAADILLFASVTAPDVRNIHV